VALVFDGNPVVGAKSINMSFASQALKQYQDLIQSVITQGGECYAPSVKNKLGKEKGDDPGTLFIAGVMHGSFGFVLEEDQSQFEMLDTRTKEAIVSADTFLQSASSDEVDFNEFLSELDTKVFLRIRAFIRTLHDAKAVLKISERSRTINLDFKRLSLAHARVTKNDIIERETFEKGYLIGFSPVKRTFDFKVDKNDRIVTGKVSQFMAINTLRYLQDISEHNDHQKMSLGRRYVAHIHMKDVKRADGLPMPTKYTLLRLDPE